MGYNENQTCSSTGQNHSLELMFAKFLTVKNREKLTPTKTGSICLRTTLKMHNNCSKCNPHCDLNL